MLMMLSDGPGTAHSFIEVLHEAPRRLEVQHSKSWSATCKTLRNLFCAQVTIITLSDPADASKPCCSTWPQLMTVVCKSQSDLKGDLSFQWEYMMQLHTEETGAVLIRSLQHSHMPLVDLPSQHCAALSAFADKHRRVATWMALQGPLLECRAVKSLTHASWPLLRTMELYNIPHLGTKRICYLLDLLHHLIDISITDCFVVACLLSKIGTGCLQFRYILLGSNELDADAISATKHANWPNLEVMDMHGCMLGTSGIQTRESCSWPYLEALCLKHACLDVPALQCQAQWPQLSFMDLCGNHIDATGISYLVQGKWPLLGMLLLSDQGLDEEGLLLLGMPLADISRIMHMADPQADVEYTETSGIGCVYC